MGCCVSRGVGVEMGAPEPEPEPELDENWHRAQAMFRMVDADGSGSLDREEVRVLGEQLGTPLVQSELDAAMRAMDEDGSGSVDFEEFYEWWKAVNQREAEGKGVWTEEQDQVQPAEPAPPSVPVSPAPYRGGGRRRDGVSPTAPHSPPPERGAARRAKPATPSEPGVSIKEPDGPETPSDESAASRLRRLLLWCRSGKKTEREECRELFDQVDDDRSGLLDVSELTQLAKLLGVALTPEQAQEAMDEIDEDKSGQVDFEEFFMWFKRTNSSQENGHWYSELGQASIKWAHGEQRRAVVRASAQRSSSVLSHALAGQRTVEEMRTMHGLAREKAG